MSPSRCYQQQRSWIGLTAVVVAIVLELGAAHDASRAGEPPPGFEAARFASEFTRRHRDPERTVDVHHVRIELRLDLPERRIEGETTLTLSPWGAAREVITLHAAELEIDAITVDETGPIVFEQADDVLRIRLPRVAPPTDTLTVRIRYAARPRLGLYFVTAPAGGSTPTEVWSQGECEDNRHWFPAWDYPNDRAASEMVVTVPDSLIAISNGTLLEERRNGDGTVTFHWLERQPHVNYLISLVVGKFVRATSIYRDIPLEIYVPPGMEDRVARSFSHTADMMRVFEETFGYPYPYAKYAQSTIHDFRWGGMENVSATTLTVRTLHDEAAHLTYRSDALVAEELAHQWFGDLVTCESWQHVWLNESFGTYAQLVYYEAKWGEDGLVDRLLNFRRGYLDEYEESYRRPIVTEIYAEPDDLFDAHSYERGALVLHMLRNLLGEQAFWRGVQHYLRTYAGSTVETAQLKIALEEVCGCDLDLFFDQWLEHGGHPQLVASWSWNEELGLVAIEVEQLQPVDDLTPIFETPLDVRVWTEGGRRDARVHLGRQRDVVHVPATKRPLLVQLDPQGWLLAQIDFRKGAGAWLRELVQAPEIVGRVGAARALAGFAGEPLVIEGLGRALREDASRHVRGQAATSLGELGSEQALSALRPGVADPDARVRRAVASALGEFESQRAAELLIHLIDTDPSPYVVGDALEALGSTKRPSALTHLLAATERPSHAETIRRGAYTGMANLENEAALTHLLAGSEAGVPWRARAIAIEGLGSLAGSLPELRDTIRPLLEQLVGDPHFAARRAAVEALGNSEDPASLPFLRELARNAYEPGVRSRARDAVRAILASDRETD